MNHQENISDDFEFTDTELGERLIDRRVVEIVLPNQDILSSPEIPDLLQVLKLIRPLVGLPHRTLSPEAIAELYVSGDKPYAPLSEDPEENVAICIGTTLENDDWVIVRRAIVILIFKVLANPPLPPANQSILEGYDLDALIKQPAVLKSLAKFRERIFGKLLVDSFVDPY